MKTGLITFHYAHHYGAQLQAFALMKVVESITGSCELIDYRLTHTVRHNRVMRWEPSLGTMARNAHSLLHYGALSRRYRRFLAMVDGHMELGDRQYSDYGELSGTPPAYDAYVCGSDQIWNPFIFENRRFDPSFFLHCIQDAPKIAYAPSFGAAELSDAQKDELRGYLDSFTALSAREKRGASIMEEVTGRRVPVTLDPTLLPDGREWEGLTSEVGGGPYVLGYFVSPPDALAGYAFTAGKELGVRIVQLAGARRRIPGAGELIMDAGPLEFLSLIRGASYVVTNSFHGVAFSLQFGKQFVCTAGGGEKQPEQSRIGSLLEPLGLIDRIVAGAGREAELVRTPIDYAAVNGRLSEKRGESLRWLSDSLGKTGDVPGQIGLLSRGDSGSRE